MSNKLKYALVGTGGIAQAYALAFSSSTTSELVAVADVRLEAARAFGERMNCRSFQSYEEMAERVAFDAVVVCTPPVTHPEIVAFFVDRKTHVLCEKPFSIDSASAREMNSAARNAGVVLTMAAKFRYVEDVIRAKSIVTSGILGDIILFENAFTSHVDMTGRWNSNPEISGGGVLIDNGTHSVDLMRYFLGPLAEVHVVEGKRSQGLPVEETVHIFARSGSGVMGNIDLSWSINKELDNYLSIYGSNGTIKVGWKQSKYRQAGSGEWIVIGDGYDKVQAFRSQIDNLTRAIRGEEELLITSDDAIASVEVIEAVYSALHQMKWMPVAGDDHRGLGSSSDLILESGSVA